jgi:tetratricopeptide (TPR) repeat protein
MKRALISPSLVLVFAGTVSLLPSSARGQEAGIEWRFSYANARQEAKEKGRPLVLEFGRKTCYWCGVLDRDTLSHPTVIKTINDNFIPLKIDGDLEPKLVQALQIDAYPTVVLADADGKILGTMEGFKDAAHFHEKLLRALALVANPEWMLRDYQAASKALAAPDYAKAITLLKGVLEDGKTRPVQQKARKMLDEIEQQAAGQLAKAKNLMNQGQPTEAVAILSELVRQYPGTASAAEAGTRMTDVTTKAPEIVQNSREKQARELLAQAKEDYRLKQHLCCMDHCKTLIEEYSDLKEAQEAQGLYDAVTANPDWMQQACEKMNERMGNMHLLLADSYLKKGKRQEAMGTLQKVMKLLPGTQHAEIARARLNQLSGQPTIIVDFKKEK